MTELVLVGVGVLVAVTTVVFGFGGGFVTAPVLAWAAGPSGGEGLEVATATSLVVMSVNAAVATRAAPRSVTGQLRSRWLLLVLLAVGGVIGAWASRSVPVGVLRWGFVTYLAVTVVEPRTRTSERVRCRAGLSPWA